MENDSKSTPARRSPLRDKPLRNPGQSIEEARHKLYEDKLEYPLVVTCGAMAVAIVEAVGHIFNQPRYPILYGVIFLTCATFLAWRVWRVRPQLKAYRLAAEGEKAVGQFLEKLRAEGYEILHDVPAGTFNIDHVIVGPPGVFTVETKTWSKPMRGDPKIAFDGETLTAAGLIPDRDPIKQSRGQVSWIATLLKESTGRQFPVRGVVLFPGWFVEQGEGTLREIWVLNPKALPAFLANAKAVLVPEDVKLANYHLSRFVRTAPDVAE